MKSNNTKQIRKKMEIKMLKKNMVIGMVISLIVMYFIPTDFAGGKNFKNTIYVDDDGGADYTKINDAINNASDGDTIYVYSGIYYENIKVYKSVKLIGENRNTTIIDSQGSGDVINITANQVTLSSFTIQNTDTNHHIGQQGIYVKSHYNIITNNKIIDNWSHGIFLYRASNNIISNNIITHNKHYGIYLQQQSNKNQLLENEVSYNIGHGIHISDYSKDNTISGNIITENTGSGIRLHYAITSTSIHGNSIKNNHKQGIYMDAGSDNNNISNNIIEDNKGMGILLDLWCNNNVISGNIIANNNREYYNDIGGIGIGSSSNNIISGNDIRDNKRESIYIYKATNNVVMKNNIMGDQNDASFEFIAEGTLKNLSSKIRDSFTNKFIRNYWGRIRLMPKPITGKILWDWHPSYAPLEISPWIVFDWHPAFKPY